MIHAEDLLLSPNRNAFEAINDVHCYTLLLVIKASRCIAYVWPYPKVKRKRGNVYENLTETGSVCDFFLCLCKIMSLDNIFSEVARANVKKIEVNYDIEVN